MKKILAVPAVLMALAPAACAPRLDTQAGRATLMARDREFARATSARGLEGWLAFFAPDATIFPPDVGITSGIEAIRAHYARTGFTPTGLTWEPAGAGVSAAGDLGYTFGTWTFQSASGDGKTAARTGKYLTLWRRQPDGGWKLAGDIGSPDLPVPTSPAPTSP